MICGRNYAKLEQVESLITSQYNVAVLPIRADVSSESDVKKCLCRLHWLSFKKINVLINNAAVFPAISSY
ncbi:hypothetical protein GCM10020331_033220 [Ectobacillus funiculus]